MLKTERKESYYQSKILTWLKRTYPEAFVFKATQGPYSNLNGVPDIIALIDGHFFGFEVKRPGGKPTKLQEIAIAQINRAGGTAAVVSTPQQVEIMIAQISEKSSKRLEN